MSYDSPRLGADGDAIADPPEAAAGQPSRPTSTDRTVAMTAELHALPALLTVAETAEVLRVGRTWVYEHAAEMGAIKLGRGRTAPLRIPRDGGAANRGRASTAARPAVGPREASPEGRDVERRLARSSSPVATCDVCPASRPGRSASTPTAAGW